MRVASLFGGKYEVSSDGKVFSNVGRRKELVGKVGNAGYRFVVLTFEGKKYYPNVHRLVSEAFIPNVDNLREVNHKDGNKLNNSVDNLEWCDTSTNQLHARDNNLCNYKMNMEKANHLRDLYKQGVPRKELCEIFGIKKTQVDYIINNKRWSV